MLLIDLLKDLRYRINEKYRLDFAKKDVSPVVFYLELVKLLL